ncbi:DUF4062 domain-containing protein [Caulobacter sp. 602-1]|uniref:DUF4062 domain-containing protein n=1 Tax=Caulobacter sp. 602-1 TaxID=2492472 RepID=UPI000F63840A|nr:DUF4062 domain-containing protein [Caulobacter sp. 602-1]RRN64797.1 DUF4062 domain-containing protein [Caulobacter sp. 602-1]
MSKKFQVFVSSTYQDLIDERQDTIKSVLDLGHIPSGMEAFHAVDFEQFTYIKKIIDECDYYVLIIGGRYGSMNDDGTSYTELEYDYAVSTGKTVLAFLHSDPSSLPTNKCDADPHALAKLEAFRGKVSTRRLVSFWSSPHDLKATVIISLSKAFSELPGTGWMRADTAPNEEILRQINQLRGENEKLKEKISSQSPKIEISNLADLDDSFEFPYTAVSRLGESKSSGKSRKTWREILSITGPNLRTISWASEIKSSLESHIKRARGSYSVSIDPDYAARIRTQLELLGLVKFASGSNSKTGYAGETAILTERGRSTLSEILAVRRSD